MTDADDILDSLFTDEPLDDVWSKVKASLRAQGLDPDEMLRRASENITAWQAHTAACKYTCAECQEGIRRAAVEIANTPELSTIIEPEDA